MITAKQPMIAPPIAIASSPDRAKVSRGDDCTTQDLQAIDPSALGADAT